MGNDGQVKLQEFDAISNIHSQLNENSKSSLDDARDAHMLIFEEPKLVDVCMNVGRASSERSRAVDISKCIPGTEHGSAVKKL